MVRNGCQPGREIRTGIGPVTVKVAKVCSRDCKPVAFRSVLVPPHVHMTGNVLDALPKTVQAKAKRALHDIWQAPTREDAEAAFDAFIETYEPKYPRRWRRRSRIGRLMTFYDFPAPRWQYLRTTNPIESTFATIRHHTARTSGCVTRHSMLHMMFKLGGCADNNWRGLRGFAYLAKVVDGVKFVNGEEIQQLDQVAA